MGNIALVGCGAIPRPFYLPALSNVQARFDRVWLVDPRPEGWSATVEEAKALDASLILLGLRVHREQAPTGTRFFDPLSADDLAAVPQRVWQALPLGPRLDQEHQAAEDYRLRRAAFAQDFIAVARRAAARHG